jgi:hypothetical protein
VIPWALGFEVGIPADRVVSMPIARSGEQEAMSGPL